MKKKRCYKKSADIWRRFVLHHCGLPDFNVFCHPAASISQIRAVIPMLLTLMALVGAVMKSYRKPISENIAGSILMSIGAFAVSLAMSAAFLLLLERSI